MERFQLEPGCIQIALLEVGFGQVAAYRFVLGIPRERQVVFCNCIIQLADYRERRAQIGVSLHRVGLESRCAPEIGDGGLDVAVLLRECSLAKGRFRILRRDLLRRLTRRGLDQKARKYHWNCTHRY